jgi:hypothetical protein
VRQTCYPPTEKGARPRLHIYAKAISAIFWLIIHAIGDISATLQGKNKKAK